MLVSGLPLAVTPPLKRSTLIIVIVQTPDVPLHAAEALPDVTLMGHTFRERALVGNLHGCHFLALVIPVE